MLGEVESHSPIGRPTKKNKSPDALDAPDAPETESRPTGQTPGTVRMLSGLRSYNKLPQIKMPVLGRKRRVENTGDSSSQLAGVEGLAFSFYVEEGQATHGDHRLGWRLEMCWPFHFM